MYGEETGHSFLTIISMKYLGFVDIRKIGYLVDKLQFNFIWFIY